MKSTGTNSDGGVIAPGYNQALDEFTQLNPKCRSILIDMETKEKAATRHLPI